VFPAVVSRRREMRNRFIHHSKVATSELHADLDGKNIVDSASNKACSYSAS
jgi:hypothetical protein